MTGVLRLLFWLSGFIVVYVYIGYPLLLALLRRLVPRRPLQAYALPSVSLLIAAYNEADVIEAKILNALAIDYPPELLEIVIASDGSTDATNAIAGRFADGRRVRLFAYEKNRRKINVLNETIPQLHGEILVLSDASSMIAPDALRLLVARFADPDVGVVSGSYRVSARHGAKLGTQEDFYWRYESSIKIAEADIHSTLGAHGSLYAIRRALYPFPAPDTINDDFIIPMRILARGFRVLYEPAAVASEEAYEMEGFTRRVRVMRGNFQQTRELRQLLHPLRPLALFLFISHKIGRLAVPFAMILLFLVNLALVGESPYREIFVLQLLFYVLAIAGALAPLRPRVLRLPYYFCMINSAVPVAAFLLLRGRGVVWNMGDASSPVR